MNDEKYYVSTVYTENRHYLVCKGDAQQKLLCLSEATGDPFIDCFNDRLFKFGGVGIEIEVENVVSMTFSECLEHFSKPGELTPDITKLDITVSVYKIINGRAHLAGGANHTVDLNVMAAHFHR